MLKLTIDLEVLCKIFPEAANLNSLPRKKKKALKKKISRGLIDIASGLAKAELLAFNKSYTDLMEEIQIVSLELEKLSNNTNDESKTDIKKA